MSAKRLLIPAIAAIGICVLSALDVNAQVSQPKPMLAEERFKNVQVLRGISVKEFMETMGFFSSALNMNCSNCHVPESDGNWDRYADDIPVKQTARRMVVMMNSINQSFFGGKREITCYSCHRTANRPKTIPNLVEQYGSPPPDDPESISEQAMGAPTPDQVIDKYIQALGGAEKLASFTSFIAKGTYEAYNDTDNHPLELYAKAPGVSFQLVRGFDGESTWSFDGTSAWVTAPETETPVTKLMLTGGDLDGAKLEAEILFPGRIRQIFTDLRVGSPVSGAMSLLPNRFGIGVEVTGVDDRELIVMQGTTSGGSNVKLYFDSKTGLLARMIRHTNLPVGFIPTQLDFSDYRDVSGVKVPFRIVKSWVDGRSLTVLQSVQPNVSIDNTMFSAAR